MGSAQTSKKQSDKKVMKNSLVRLFLGNDTPDIYTKLTFNILFIISFIFLIWNIAGFIAISYQDLLYVHRHVAIDSLFAQRAEKLGFTADEFTHRLSIFFIFGICCWIMMFSALALLWRKNSLYLPILLFGTLFYVGMHIFYLGYDYFKTDTSSFDKLALLTLFAISILHSFILKREQSGASLSFFGEDDE
jgi:hypothetical protein